MKRSEHTAVAEAFSAYTTAAKPTAVLTRDLLSAIAGMVAADHATRVTVTMHGLVVIKRGPAESAQRLQKAMF